VDTTFFPAYVIAQAVFHGSDIGQNAIFIKIGIISLKMDRSRDSRH
jgi:hypothetical protein